MHILTRSALGLSLLGMVAACDELAVANDPAALAELRGQKSCVAAVAGETGASNVAINTTIPVIEVNRFIVDVPAGGTWSCITDANGKAIEIVERNTG